MTLSIIVAYSANRVIGRDNQLPWRLPQDLAHFKATTMGAPIIMGRKTWQSIGRPLPGRTNIVISRNAQFEAPGATVVTSLEQAMQACAAAPCAFVIGGAQLYMQALDHADEIIATELACQVQGDAYFPLLPSFAWKQVDKQEQQPVAMFAQDSNAYGYAYVTYRRVK